MWNLTGWIFSVHHPEHHCTSLIQVVLQKAVCFVQLLELKEHGDFIVSQSNISSHPVNHSKQTLKQQGLFWGIWLCTGHRCFFLNDKFFSTCHFSTCNYFKTTSHLADPFHHLAGKGNLGISGELRNVNGLELHNSAVCQSGRALNQPRVLCALLEKLI